MNKKKTKLGQELIKGLTDLLQKNNINERTTLRIEIPKKIRDYRDKLAHEGHKLSKNSPRFFTSEMKIDKKVKKEFKNHFSSRNYSEDSAGTFETWPVMKLLEQAMEIGYRMGSDPDYYTKNNKLMNIYKELESQNLVVIKGLREFNLFSIESFVWEKDKTYYVRSDLRNIDNSPITGEIKNPKFTPKAVLKAYKLWLKKMDKLASK